MTLDTEDLLILGTKLASMQVPDAITYLASKKIQLSETEYKNKIKTISEDAQQRLYDISKDYAINHLEHIEKLLSIEMHLWELFRARKNIIKMVKRENLKEIGGRVMKENIQDTEVISIDQDPVERSKILHEIREIQRYISSYREHTKRVMEQSIIQFGQERDMDMTEYLLENEPNKCLPNPREAET